MGKKFSLLIFIFCLFCLSFVSATWIIDAKYNGSPAFFNGPSGLTTYIKNQSANTTNSENLFIYDQGTVANSFTEIKSDVTYNQFSKTITLGSKEDTLVIKDNVTFTHIDSQITYNESNFSSTTNFTATSGSTWVNGKYSSRLYSIKLIGDIQITNGASLSIGSIICSVTSSGTGNNGGIINGDFVELDLNGHSITIDSGATLNAYGYIIDSNPKTDNNGNCLNGIYNYGTIYSPFVVENFWGGSFTVGTALVGTCPFTIYSVPYLNCYVEFNYNSFLLCPTSLYANETVNKTVIKLIGNSSSYFLQMHNSSSKIIRRGINNPSIDSTQLFYHSNYRETYKFHGTISVNTMILSVSLSGINVDIDMAQFYFPISPYLDIVVASDATINLPLTLEFYPGSTLLCEEGSKINLTSITTKASTVTIVITVTVLPSKSSYGGIIVPTELPPTSLYAYTPVAYDASMFQKHQIQEYDKFSTDYIIHTDGSKTNNINTNSRINIFGNINSISGYHTLAGKINLGNDIYNFINNNKSKFNLFARYQKNYNNEIGASELVSAVMGGNIKKYTASNISLPLVSNGQVIKEASMSYPFTGNATFDFNTGIFNSNGNTYAFINSQNSICPVEEDNNLKCVYYTDPNEITLPYIYFRNYFLPVTQYDTGIYNDQNYPVDFTNESSPTTSYTYAGETYYKNYTTSGFIIKTYNVSDPVTKGAGYYSNLRVHKTSATSADGITWSSSNITNYQLFLSDISTKISSETHTVSLVSTNVNASYFDQFDSSTTIGTGYIRITYYPGADETVYTTNILKTSLNTFNSSKSVNFDAQLTFVNYTSVTPIKYNTTINCWVKG